jgi:primosomal protein N'
MWSCPSGQAPTFTYLDPSGTLRPGDLVRIPFGNRRIDALVWEAHGRQPTFATKSVDERLLEKPFVPVHLIDLCRWIAEYYLCPPGVAAGPLWSCAGKSTFVRLGLGKRVASKSKRREPQPPPAATHRFELNLAQQATASTLRAALDTDGFQPFLLHGITGSGKTAVFLDTARHALDKGKQVLILVPEIGLTPQTVKRTAEALGERVATLHSQISDSERADAWTSLRDGNCRVALGPRSALFAPLFDPGLVVVDEEHDGSYKQNGDAPRYHGRDAAVWLARRCSVPVVLGSATPSLESWHNAKTGRYGFLDLPERAAGALPHVEAVDLREGRKSTGSSISPRLRTAMSETLAKGERVMVLHNRRGWAPQAECLDCGAPLECPDCPGLRLTWHRESARLVCHHCGHAAPLPRSCPACGGRSLEPQGWAIQRVQEEMERLFPGHQVVRLDRDIASRKGGHGLAMDSFLGQGGILLGTQMIAKGHDIPDVTLVGVTDSDIGAGMPDFRAAERTFQLLCQVAGRAAAPTCRAWRSCRPAAPPTLCCTTCWPTTTAPSPNGNSRRDGSCRCLPSPEWSWSRLRAKTRPPPNAGSAPSPRDCGRSRPPSEARRWDRFPLRSRWWPSGTACTCCASRRPSGPGTSAAASSMRWSPTRPPRTSAPSPTSIRWT